MIFHADSDSDLKTSPNQIKNHISSKIRFLWYFDLKFPLRFEWGKHGLSTLSIDRPVPTARFQFEGMAPFEGAIGLAPMECRHTVHGIFDRTVKRSEKNYKNRSRKIGTFKKNEKQKCDLQFAPTELDDFNI